MGKVKKHRSRAKTARKSVDPIARNEAKDEETRQQKILPLIAQLSSATAGDRATAISAIIAMAEDTRLRELLLKEKLVQTVMTQSLSDSSEEIVAEAYGLLRNLVIEEGYDVAIFMYRQDILTPAEASLTTVKTALGNGPDTMAAMTNDQRTLVFEYLENVLGLLSALAVSDETIFEAITKKLVDIGRFAGDLLLYLKQLHGLSKKVVVPKQVVDAVTEFVYVLSEANSEFVKQFPVSAADEIIEADSSSISKIHANGLKYNVYVESRVQKSDEVSADVILEIMKSIVSIVGTINIEEARQAVKPMIENAADPATIQQANLRSISARSDINAVQVSLELLAAIAETIAVDPSLIYGKPVHEEDKTDDVGDEMEEAIISDDAYFEKAIAETEHMADDDDIEADSHHTLGEDATVNYLHQSVLPLISKYLSVPEMTSRAMAALNNTTWTLAAKIPIEDTEWNQHAQELYTNVFEYLSSDQIDVLTGCVGVLDGIAKAFKGEVPAEIDGKSLVVMLVDLCSRIKETYATDEWSGFVIRTVSLVGCLGMTPNRMETTKQAADFLFSIIDGPLGVPALILVEALNAIFDLFGDKEYEYDESLFVQPGRLNDLKQTLPKIRQAARKIEKKKDPQLRHVTDQAALNLVRFIDYKSKERDM
jgi:hypothetical protein